MTGTHVLTKLSDTWFWGFIDSGENWLIFELYSKTNPSPPLCATTEAPPPNPWTPGQGRKQHPSPLPASQSSKACLIGWSSIVLLGPSHFVSRVQSQGHVLTPESGSVHIQNRLLANCDETKKNVLNL